jgi:hypothetical protein
MLWASSDEYNNFGERTIRGTLRVVYLGAIGPNVHNFTGITKKVDFGNYEKLSETVMSPEDTALLESEGEVIEEDIHNVSFNQSSIYSQSI